MYVYVPFARLTHTHMQRRVGLGAPCAPRTDGPPRPVAAGNRSKVCSRTRSSIRSHSACIRNTHMLFEVRVFFYASSPFPPTPSPSRASGSLPIRTTHVLTPSFACARTGHMPDVHTSIWCLHLYLIFRLQFFSLFFFVLFSSGGFFVKLRSNFTSAIISRVIRNRMRTLAHTHTPIRSHTLVSKRFVRK